MNNRLLTVLAGGSILDSCRRAWHGLLMYLAAIPEIRVETAGNDVTYWLPARPLGFKRWFGLLLIGFSVLWLSSLLQPLRDIVRQLSTSKQPGFEYFMLAFLLGFVVIGFFPAGIGLLGMFGRCRIMWRDGRLTVSDTLGPFGWRRRMARATIRKFTAKAGVAGNRQPVAGAPPTGKATLYSFQPANGLNESVSPFGLATLVAEFEKGKPRIVAWGYPQEWLAAIATDLSGRAGGSQMVAPKIEVTDEITNPPKLHDVVDKPANSKVVIQRQSSGIVLEVPPAGIWKGSAAFFLLAIVWCLFLVVFTSVVVFGKWQGPARELWPFWDYIVVFWAVGLGMMAGAINLGKRRATLTAGKSGLIVVQTGPFGVKRREFRRDEIAAIRADASNVEVNHTRLVELQIHPVTGKKLGLFVNRDDAELRWMATELRNALGVPANS